MNADISVGLLWGIGALVLVLGALAARRPSLGAVLRALIGWAIIAAILYLVFANRAELTGLATRIASNAGIADQQIEGDTVRIRQSADGHFWASVRLNGIERRMLVDSGATITALSQATAAAAAIDTSGGLPVVLTTANGNISAQRGAVQAVSLGSLETRDLPVVVSSSFAGLDVLGMNFLSRLGSWRVEGSTLILEPDVDASSIPEGNAIGQNGAS